MTLEESLQGEWMCLVGDQHIDDAWRIEIVGRNCQFEELSGILEFDGEEAGLDLGDGTRLAINRSWLAPPPGGARMENKPDCFPVVLEERGAILEGGFMMRPEAARR